MAPLCRLSADVQGILQTFERTEFLFLGIVEWTRLRQHYSMPRIEQMMISCMYEVFDSTHLAVLVHRLVAQHGSHALHVPSETLELRHAQPYQSIVIGPCRRWTERPEHSQYDEDGRALASATI